MKPSNAFHVILMSGVSILMKKGLSKNKAYLFFHKSVSLFSHFTTGNPYLRMLLPSVWDR